MNKKEVFLQIPVSKEFKEKIKKKAEEKGLSISAYVRLLITSEVK